MSAAIFWILATLLTGCALGAVLSRNLYHAAYWLAGALVITAIFYLALTAPLLAAVQILLYTGGVLTLVVTAMVITAHTDEVKLRWRRPIPALVLAVLVLAVLASFVDEVGTTPVGGLEDGRAAGIELFSRYLVPFELLSILLLGAIFGALAIARRERSAS